MIENIGDPFGVCFSLLKIKYMDYDESLTSKDFLQPNDKINLFINLESLFKNISMIQELEQKIYVQRDFDVLMISYIINLAAHYYRFFRSNDLDTNVYLYNTDFDSDEFNQYKYNEDFRGYYLVKYNNNPKFALLTEHLKNEILPKVKIITEYIPNIHYISAYNIEGSLVPYIISQVDTSRKNLIVGNELYDTQYSQIPNFVNHYIHRGRGYNHLCSSTSDYIRDILKSPEEDASEITKLLNTYSNYCSLMSVIGDKSRSVDKIIGIGAKTFLKKLQEGIINKVIVESTTNPEIIGDVLKDKDAKEEFINNFYCTSIIPMYDELTEGEIDSVVNQKKDKSDINSLQDLNTRMFYNYPLLLEALLC